MASSTSGSDKVPVENNMTVEDIQRQGISRPANMSSMLTLLQIADSGFPTGGFSHSMGYEAALKKGHITNMVRFKEFVLSAMENVGSSSIPFVKAAYLNNCAMSEIEALDKLCEACLNNHVAKRASIQQGKSLISTSSEAFPDGRIKQLKVLINEDRVKGHHALMFGCLCAYVNITLNDCLEVYMYNALRTIMASAVRLGNLGPLEAQHIQYEMQQCIGRIIERNFDSPVEDTAITFPIVDILQNTHDTLFSRLFVS
ncbi:uncharacterized protein [Amphiura filiformis]|uniref:uncharacterized protein n=1 Tax=Amphiura filiformis TaxID=82378 RepID=UPI003B2150C4